MSRAKLNRIFDTFWPMEEKFIRVLSKQELSILQKALTLYIEKAHSLDKDYKRWVDYNSAGQIKDKIEAAQNLLSQMAPVQLFDFDLLMNQNLSTVKVDREQECK
jgi:hypothetical protein